MSTPEAPSDGPADELQERVAALRPATDLVQRELRAQVAAALFEHAPVQPRLGRYTVLSREGRGGMGTVFAAWDHRLQRRVALKVLHRDHGRDRQDRILAEARALAQLTHPNVVGVYDVGREDDEAFIAMELVVGAALGLHVRRTSPTPDRLAAWLADAAAGLAAAHAVGLVHGDVTPANIVVGDDARVRVIDFGLATTDRDDRVRGGTPGYVAPELARGGAPTPAADVFALAIVARELRGAIGPGRWPKRLRRAIERALADDPRARGEMSELRAALRASSRTVGQRRTIAATLGLGLGLIAITAEPAPRCPLPIEARWHAELRARTEHALFRHGERGLRLWSRIVAPLDQRAEAWSIARDAACAMPGSERDPIAACLEDHGVELAALVEQLEGATTLPRADRVLAAIGEPRRCLSDAATGVEDVELRHGIARVHVAEALGDTPGALRLAVALEADARRAGDPIGRAETELDLGRLLALTGDPHGGVSLLHEAYFRAWAQRDERLAIRAMLAIMQVTADSLGDPAEAERWRGPLLAALALDRPPIALRVRALEALAWLAEHAGEWTTMREMAEELLRQDPQVFIDDPRAQYRVRILYASVLRHLGDPVGQVSQLLAATSAVGRVQAPDHPDVGLTHIALGSAWDDLGELERAEAALTFGIAMLERAEIFDRLGDPHYLLGRVYANQGETARARTEFETSARLLAQYRGADHPDAVLPLIGLAELATGAGELDAARGHYERALAIATRPSDRGYLHFGLGLVAAEARDWDRAIAEQRRARELLGEPAETRVMQSETWYAEALALRGRGDAAAARAALLRARELASEPPQLVEMIAAVDLALGD